MTFNGTLASHAVLSTLGFNGTTNVDIFVRAYSADRRGTANFTIRRAGVQVYTTSIEFAGSTLAVGNLSPATDVWTQEEWNGPSDTVLLAMEGNPVNTIRANDDDGLGFMSYMRLNACSNCVLAFGRYNSSSASGPGTVAWDGDVANSLDTDADGVGNSLEAMLSTKPNVDDSDQDGLDDGAEIIGIDGPLPQKLYTWGADPLANDLFLEVDWVDCVGNSTICPQGSNTHRLTGAEADTTVAAFGPDIRLHMDIGVSHPYAVGSVPQTKQQWTSWGAWVGAFAGPSGEQCSALSPWRAGLFHHYHLLGFSGGGQTAGGPTSRCSHGGRDLGAIGHEVGHQLGLTHGGNVGRGKMNNKPNYMGMMNYAYEYDIPSFSRGFEPTINPISLVESGSPMSPQALTRVSATNYYFHFPSNPSARQIDWNRDGVMNSSTPSRGAPTWGVGDATELGNAYAQEFGTERDPSFMLMPSLSRLYVFSLADGSSTLQYRYTQDNFSNCKDNDAMGSCVAWVGPKTVYNSSVNGFSAATRVVVGGVDKILLVYAKSTNQIFYQIGTLGTPNDTWSLPKLIGTANYFNKPALVSSGPGGIPRVYYRDLSGYDLLTSQDYNAATDSWTGAKYELTDGGAPMFVLHGASITAGVDSVALTWFAAIPVPGTGAINLWRLDLATDRWTLLSNVWSVTQVATDDAPALAYVPTSPSNPLFGQFFLLYNPTGDNHPQILKTQGNGAPTAATGKFQFLNNPVPFWDQSLEMIGSPTLIYHPGANANLRAASRFIGATFNGVKFPDNIRFSPVADGVVNIGLSDQNDYGIMTSVLRCSLVSGVMCPPL